MKYNMLSDSLNERQRRLWAATETLSLGYGAISAVSRTTGISRVTITRGIKEINEESHLPPQRSRLSGGGRKKGCGPQPNLKPPLEAIIEPAAKGDPMSPLRWTTHSTRRLAQTLRRQGFDTSKSQIYRLLGEMEYQLAANRKPFEGGTNPDRNGQFEFISEQSSGFLKRGHPVISVDAKKKELVGNFKQNGRVWRPKGNPGNWRKCMISLIRKWARQRRMACTI